MNMIISSRHLLKPGWIIELFFASTSQFILRLYHSINPAPLDTDTISQHVFLGTQTQKNPPPPPVLSTIDAFWILKLFLRFLPQKQ